MDFLKYILFFYCITIFAEQNSAIPETVQQEMEQLLQLDFKERYQIFYYDKLFAKTVHLNSDNAYQLAPHLHGVGLTIKKTEDEEGYLPEYECYIHLFVDLDEDYWLPSYHYSSTFASNNYEFYVRHVLGLEFFGGIDQQNSDNFATKSRHSNAYYQENPNFALAGTIRLKTMLRFKEYNLLYLEYWNVCHDFSSLKEQQFAIWVEKKGGPDFKYSASGPIKAKYFYHFALPKSLLQTACPYLQRARAFESWNYDLFNVKRNYRFGWHFENLKDIMEC